MEIKLIKKKALLTHETLFVMYFWGFALLRPILQRYEGFSTQILFLYVSMILITSIFKLLKSKIFVRAYLLVMGIFFIFMVDFLFRPNQYIVKYIYEFLIYGVIPIHLLSQVKSTKQLLNIFSWVSLIVFILYFSDPLKGYVIFGDYMSFGFNLALPAYFGLYVGRNFFHRKWMLIFEIICFLDIIIYANRSAILSIFVLWIMIELFYKKSNIRKMIEIILFLLCCTAGLYFLEDIISFSNLLLNHFGFYSFSLRRIQLMLMQDDWSGIFSGRMEIWNYAKNMFRENVLIGSGTGAFQSRYSFYSHNLYYDILTQYGLLGLSIFILFIVKSFKNMVNQEGLTKILGIILFCLWFPKLFFSMYIYKDIGIWSFLAYGFLKFENFVTGE